MLGVTDWLVAIRRIGSTTERVVVDIESRPSALRVVSTYSGTPERPLGTAPIRRAAEHRPLAELAGAIWRALDPNLRVALIAGRGGDPEPVLWLPEQTS